MDVIHNMYIKPFLDLTKHKGPLVPTFNTSTPRQKNPTFDFSSSATDFLRSPVRAWWEVMDAMGPSVNIIFLATSDGAIVGSLQRE